MSKIILLTLPIGNMGDITKRVLDYLENSNIFVVEDTRSFKSIMQLLEIDFKGKKIISYFDNSDSKVEDYILKLLLDGNDICLLSEAGSPIISDPAYPLLKKCVENKIEIDCAPGVSSVVAALELSALPPNPFHFYGFIPRDRESIKLLVNSWQNIKGTHIFFESPNRINKSLPIVSQIFQDSDIVIAREITKKFQSVYRFKGREYESILEEIPLKGEIVVLVNNSQAGKRNQIDNKLLKDLINDYLNTDRKSTKQLSKIMSLVTGEASKDIYKKLLSSK